MDAVTEQLLKQNDERRTQLAELRGSISPHLYDAVAAKLSFERSSIDAVREREHEEEVLRDAHRQLLPEQFFVEVPLDRNAL